MNEPMLSIHAMSGALYVCAGADVCVQVSVCGCGCGCLCAGVGGRAYTAAV